MTTDFFKFEDKEYDLPLLNDDPRFTARNVAILIIGFLIASAIPYLIPPTGNTLPRKVISPVMATASRTLRCVSAEAKDVAMVIPADGPSLGTAPSGT